MKPQSIYLLEMWIDGKSISILPLREIRSSMDFFSIYSLIDNSTALVLVLAFVLARSASIRSSFMLIVVLMIFSYKHTFLIKSYITASICQNILFFKKTKRTKGGQIYFFIQALMKGFIPGTARFWSGNLGDILYLHVQWIKRVILYFYLYASRLCFILRIRAVFPKIE